MKLASIIIEELKQGTYDELLNSLYVDKTLLDKQKIRYISALNKYIELYDDEEVEIYSAPGRSEIGGNHTDHNNGQVLACAINLDIIGIVSKNDTINVVSDDQFIDEIVIEDIKKEIEVSSSSLIKGVVYRLKELGYKVGGFKGYFTSEVLIGSGLSSSAAFEVLIGNVISGLYNDQMIDPILIGKVGQYSENVFFNKPCGLMDQCASSMGGLINIDFKDVSNPIVNKVDVNFDHFNHSLCVVDALGNHEDLTPDYAAIPQEMKEVAKFFNKEVLREIDEDSFLDNTKEIRNKLGDRCFLRALHFYEENKRVEKQVNSLTSSNFEEFKLFVKESGDSSFKYLQNVYSPSDVKNQSISIALSMSEKILKDKGVCRVHGGGFAGTILAIVENDFVSSYKQEIEKVFSKGCCYVLKSRPIGGTKVI